MNASRRPRVLDGRGLIPAVVREVDEQRLLAQAATLDVLDQLPDQVVVPGTGGEIARSRTGEPLAPIALLELLRRRVGNVRKHRCEPDEEGIVAVGIDEVVNRLHGLSTQLGAFASPGALLVVRVDHPIGESGGLEGAFPVLSRLEGPVAPRRQKTGQGIEVFDREVLVEIRVRPRQAADPVVPLVGVESGQQAGQRGPAVAPGVVGPEKDGAVRGQRIQIRRLDVWRARETEVGKTVIVADHENDVRSRGIATSRCREQQRSQPQQEGAQGRHGCGCPRRLADPRADEHGDEHRAEGDREEEARRRRRRRANRDRVGAGREGQDDRAQRVREALHRRSVQSDVECRVVGVAEPHVARERGSRVDLDRGRRLAMLEHRELRRRARGSRAWRDAPLAEEALAAGPGAVEAHRAHQRREPHPVAPLTRPEERVDGRNRGAREGSPAPLHLQRSQEPGVEGARRYLPERGGQRLDARGEDRRARVAERDGPSVHGAARACGQPEPPRHRPPRTIHQELRRGSGRGRPAPRRRGTAWGRGDRGAAG